MSSLKDYAAGFMRGVWQGLGDVAKAGIGDVGDSYQEILTGHSYITAPDGLTVDYVTTHSPKPEAPMNDRQLERLIEEQRKKHDASGPDMG